MDFAFTETQDELAALTRRIVDDLVTDDSLRRTEQQPDHFDRDLWRELARTGVLGVGLPEDVGGGGAELVTQCRVLVELGRGVVPAPMVPSICMAAAAVAEFGSPTQRERWVRPAAAVDDELVEPNPGHAHARHGLMVAHAASPRLTPNWPRPRLWDAGTAARRPRRAPSRAPRRRAPPRAAA